MKHATIGEIADIRSGFGFPKNLQGKDSGKFPFAKVGDISRRARAGHVYIDTADHWIDDIDNATIKGRPLPEGSIVFAKIGEAIRQNYRAICGRPMFIDNNAMGLVPDPQKVHTKYLYHFMCQTDLYALTEKTSVPSLRKSVLERLSLPLPPLPEQKRIADILDKADAIRRKRAQALELTDQFLQSVFLDMFGDPVTNPKGWERVRLDKLCDVRDGTHDSPKYQNHGWPLITSKNLRNSQLDFEGANLISEEDFVSISRRSGVTRGDILMPMIGTIGNPVIVDTDRPFAIKNVALIRSEGSKICLTYLHKLLNSHFFDYSVRLTNRGGSQKFVALGDLRAMEIPTPSADLQEEFYRIARATESTRTKLQSGALCSDALFSALAQQAFRGTL